MAFLCVVLSTRFPGWAVVAAAATPSLVGGWQGPTSWLRTAPTPYTPSLASCLAQGCGEKCPYVPGLQILDWPLTDPKGKPIEEVRRWTGGAQEEPKGQGMGRWRTSRAGPHRDGLGHGGAECGT